jgi:hypothetical protein
MIDSGTLISNSVRGMARLHGKPDVHYTTSISSLIACHRASSAQ